MSSATITQAQQQGLRQQFGALLGAVRGFAAGLYAAHGGWTAPRDRLMALADQAAAHSPSLSNELRNFASRG
jgi:predicted phage gp36 major capsid-like protein